MADIKKVIKGLEHCAERRFCNDDCPYSDIIRDQNSGMDECISALAKDALELLKEQQTEVDRLKAEQPKKGHWEKAKHASDRWHSCSVCGVTIERLDHNGFKLICNYCPVCGAEMKNGGVLK